MFTWVLTWLGFWQTHSRSIAWLVDHANVDFMLIGVQCAEKAQHADGLGKKRSISKQTCKDIRCCVTAWSALTARSVGLLNKCCIGTAQTCSASCYTVIRDFNLPQRNGELGRGYAWVVQSVNKIKKLDIVHVSHIIVCFFSCQAFKTSLPVRLHFVLFYFESYDHTSNITTLAFPTSRRMPWFCSVFRKLSSTSNKDGYFL